MWKPLHWSGFCFIISLKPGYPFKTSLHSKHIKIKTMKTILMVLMMSSLVWISPGMAQKVVRKGVQPTKVKSPSQTVFYNIDQLAGKWQEITRKNAERNEVVHFTDTLRLNFNKRDSVYIYDGISMSQKGLVSIEGPTSLSLAGDTYSILSMNNTSLILNDGEFIRSFRKTDRFYHETLGNLKADPESFEKPMAINAVNLQGRWDVYRRQANPGTTDSVLIKSITFTTSTNNSITGTVSTYTSGNTKTENFTGYISGTTLVINAPNFKGNWTTYKADGKEFVFGKEKEIIYYAKKF